MADYGASDTSTTALGTNQFPISDVYVPNVGLRATEGGPATADGGGKVSAPMAVSVKDGSDVTQGTSTDANTVNSVMGRLTKIRDLLNATLTVGGTITEANSAAIKADLDAVNTAIGLISDAAWSGSGNGSEIAILKKIVAQLGGTLAVSGTFWQATQPVSGTVTANAGTNLNTSSLALEAGGNLASLVTNTADLLADGDFLATLGNKTDAKSTATDATSISIMQVLKEISAMLQAPASTPVTGTFWQATQPVSGTVTANAGTNLNTSALALEAGHLATIDSHIPAQGQALAAASMPVVLPATQITTLTPPAAITGFALEAGHLATIDTHTPALGQAAMASSSPVVIASNQSAFPVTQGAGAAAGTSWRTAGDFTEIAGAGTGVVTGINTDFLAATDVSAYKYGSVQVAGTFTLTLTIQGSNNNADWVTVYNSGVSGAGTLQSTITSAGIYLFPIAYRWLRIRCTVFTSNASLAGNIELYTSSTVPNQTLTSAIQPGNTPNTTPWLVSAGPPADLTLLASAARTTTQTVADQTNFYGKGLRVVLDVTVIGTGSITLTILAKDVASGKYSLLLAGAAVIANSTNVYVIHPELTAAANSIAKDVLPHTWQVVVTANNANAVTYSVGASYLN